MENQQNKKLKVIHKVSIDDAYPYNLFVVYGKDMNFNSLIKEAAKTEPALLSLIEQVGSDNEPLSFVCDDENSTCIYLFIKDDTTLATLVHECVHIVVRIFDIIGMKINRDTEEMFAYLEGFIFKKVYNLMTKKLNLNPKVIDED